MRKLGVCLLLVLCLGTTGCSIKMSTLTGESEHETEGGKESFFNKLFKRKEVEEVYIPTPEEISAELVMNAEAAYKSEIGETTPGERIVERYEKDQSVYYSVYLFDETGWHHKYYLFAGTDEEFEYNQTDRLSEFNIARKSTNVDYENYVVSFDLEYVQVQDNAYEYYRSVIDSKFKEEAVRLDLDEGVLPSSIPLSNGYTYMIVGDLVEFVPPPPELVIDDSGMELCLTDAEYFEYEETNDGTVIITGYNCEYLGQKLVFPEEIDGKQVTGIERMEPVDGVKLVEIPGCVLRIGDTFKHWKDLENVVLNEGIESIGTDFITDTKVEDVQLPDSVYALDDNFFEKSGITLQIPKEMSSLQGALRGLDFEEYIIPETVQVVPDSAFEDCKNLTTLFVSEGVVQIGSNVFKGCDSLQAVALPNSVQDISDAAFEDVPNVMLVVQPGSYAEQYAVQHNITYVSG